MTILPFAEQDQQNARARRSPTPPASPLDEIVQEAARKLASLKMTRLVLEPEAQDAKNITDDVLIVADIFDGVLQEMGRYAGEYFGINSTEIEKHFSGVVRNALEGNGLFVIEEAMRDIQDNRMSQMDRDFGERG